MAFKQYETVLVGKAGLRAQFLGEFNKDRYSVMMSEGSQSGETVTVPKNYVKKAK